MSLILYYSNFCEPSKNLLKSIAQSQMKEEIHFICIDKRVKGKDGATYVVLENNTQMILPPTVTKVPALLLLNRGHQVLFGQQIYQHLQPKEEQYTQQATHFNQEPLAFSVSEMGGCSDNYSYLDMSSDELSAKGNGGERIMHSYAGINISDQIETPPEDYDPGKVGNVSLEQLQQQRNSEIPKPVMRQ